MRARRAPFVGHATVAAHAVLLALGRRGAGVLPPAFRDRHHRGAAPSEAAIAAGRETLIEFRQTVPELDTPLPFKTTLRVAEALRLPATQLHEVMPARIARKGSTRLLVPIARSARTGYARPEFRHPDCRSARELGAEGFFVFALNRESNAMSSRPSRACSARRSASRRIRSAATPTPCWRRICSNSASSARIRPTFIGRQGRQMKRPGQVSVRLEIDQGSLVAAHIGGSAVIVSEGTLGPVKALGRI